MPKGISLYNGLKQEHSDMLRIRGVGRLPYKCPVLIRVDSLPDANVPMLVKIRPGHEYLTFVNKLSLITEHIRTEQKFHSDL